MWQRLKSRLPSRWICRNFIRVSSVFFSFPRRHLVDACPLWCIPLHACKARRTSSWHPVCRHAGQEWRQRLHWLLGENACSEPCPLAVSVSKPSMPTGGHNRDPLQEWREKRAKAHDVHTAAEVTHPFASSRSSPASSQVPSTATAAELRRRLHEVLQGDHDVFSALVCPSAADSPFVRNRLEEETVLQSSSTAQCPEMSMRHSTTSLTSPKRNSRFVSDAIDAELDCGRGDACCSVAAVATQKMHGNGVEHQCTTCHGVSVRVPSVQLAAASCSASVRSSCAYNDEMPFSAHRTYECDAPIAVRTHVDVCRYTRCTAWFFVWSLCWHKCTQQLLFLRGCIWVLLSLSHSCT